MGLAVARASHTITRAITSPAGAGIGAFVAGAGVATCLSVANRYASDDQFPRSHPEKHVSATPMVLGGVGALGVLASLIGKRPAAALAFTGGAAGSILGVTLLDRLTEKMMADSRR